MNSKASLAKKKVFLVDDHPLVREWLTNLINQTSDLVVCGDAESAPQALEAIARIKPDIAIIDLSLTDSSGLDLIKNVKQSCQGVVILVLSMHEESQYAQRALRAGAQGYVMKRETTQKVLEAIRQILQGKLFISPEVATALATQAIEGRATTGRSPVEQLSDRELEVFELLGKGQGTRQIAESLRVSIKTVQAYCMRIKEKLQIANATDLLREAFRWHDTNHKG